MCGKLNLINHYNAATAGKGIEMYKLNQEEVAKSDWNRDTIAHMQTAVFVMCGGGYLGNFAATQPAKFYIDDRVSRLPYGKKAIYQAVETLCTVATANGLDPNRLPERPQFHNCGIF